MSITFKIKRGSKLENDGYTGAIGEFTMQTVGPSNDATVRIHDGTTAGGIELARADFSNTNITNGAIAFEYRFNSSALSAANVLTNYHASYGIYQQTDSIVIRLT